MIHCGDLFDVLPTLPEASIDACVTDPPYGIGFMGKKWDTFSPAEVLSRIVPNRKVESDNPNLKGRQRGPASSPSAVDYDRSLKGQHEFQAWTERWAREVFRVLKPGAHLLVCGAPRSYHRMASGLEDAWFEIRDCLAWIFGQGFPKSLNFEDGWGTALKPAYEPIVLARKPFKGRSVGANRKAHGTGAINVDACRVDFSSADAARVASPSAYGSGTQQFTRDGVRQDNGRPGVNRAAVVVPQGRWPSNVALDEDAAAMLDVQTGEMPAGGSTDRRGKPHGYVDGRTSLRDDFMLSRNDPVGGSRFFYVAKPSRAERDQGGETRNIHPTVKPVDLMRWLVRLVTPTGGTVLDPFAGSGTTGMASAFEGFQFVGIEREAEYVAIAERRISTCVPLLRLDDGVSS